MRSAFNDAYAISFYDCPYKTYVVGVTVVSPVSRFTRGSLRPGSIRQWVVLPQSDGSFRPRPMN